MKNLIFILTALFSISSCAKSTSENEYQNKTIADPYGKTSEIVDISTNYVNGFIEIRQHIYLKDINKLKNHFNFPIKDENIWFLVDSDGEIDSKKPFTEKDFEKYYSKIFEESFIKSLLKIKSKELFNKGKYTTEIISHNEGDYIIKSRIVSSYSKNHTLTLSFYSDYYINNEKLSERLCSYIFKWINGKFIFDKIVIAG